MIEIVTIETPSLGDRTYLVTDGASALVIDPQRDIGRVLAVAATRGVEVTHVFETHIHNDYVSGGLALARLSGAAYHVNAADAVAFSRVGIGDGDTIAVGRSIRVRVIATPGHTFTHLAYALEDAATGEVTAVFTGGSLLHGSTGRPDLLGPEHTLILAAAQHASARRLTRMLPDQATVYPTHGFGSFCAASAAGPAGSTIGEEKRSNPALTLGEDGYVTALVEGLDAYPAYYAHMAAANAAGPDAPDPAPPWTARTSPSWTFAGHPNGPAATSRARFTCRSTSCPAACASCCAGRSGSTARPATAPASPPPCYTRPGTPSSPSTTTSAGRPVRACPSPGQIRRMSRYISQPRQNPNTAFRNAATSAHAVATAPSQVRPAA